jgi:hypothetical protein
MPKDRNIPSSTVTPGAAAPPIAVTIREACRISGLGQTSIWKLRREGRLETVHVPGCDRALVTYRSLVELLTPSAEAPRRKRGRPRRAEQQAQDTAPMPPPRRRGRPRRATAQLPETATATT